MTHHTCTVQWVDGNGKPTPDSNSAVMLAHFHEPQWVGGKVVGYGAVRDSFPICAQHYEQVRASWRLENGGGWTFSPLIECEQTIRTARQVR